MEFALTPEQEQFAKDFQNYLRTHMTPELIAELDKEIAYSESPLCMEFIRQMAATAGLE